MSFLLTDSVVRYIDAKSISLKENLPVGIYKMNYSDMTGIFLEEFKFENYSGKVYGNAKKIASHIIDSYHKISEHKNLGVLLSGEKGLGKSLTVKLIIEQLKDTYPIVFINEFYDDIYNFLRLFKNTIIVFDEFDKTFRGSVNEEASTSSGIKKQETLLSTLDGTDNNSHNMYLLTCNDLNEINSNLISRPSRIRYHYRFKSIDEDAIREYCEDNLKNKTLIQDIVDSLLSTRFVSFDILQSLVEELNTYDISVLNAIEYLNIDAGTCNVTIRITYSYDNNIHVQELHLGSVKLSDNNCKKWITLTDIMQENEDIDNDVLIRINFTKVKVPPMGYVDITNYFQIINKSTLNDTFKVLKCEVKDSDGFFLV